MSQGNPSAGEVYRHFKGNLYEVVTLAKNADNLEPMVVYRSLYGDPVAYVRSFREFVSEVDHEKYPFADQKYRFLLVEDLAKAVPKSPAATVPAPEPEQEEQADPWLIQFLDADTMDEKYNVLLSMRPAITDRLIDDLATLLDVVIEPGPTELRYRQLKNCLAMKKKFEMSR